MCRGYVLLLNQMQIGLYCGETNTIFLYRVIRENEKFIINSEFIHLHLLK